MRYESQKTEKGNIGVSYVSQEKADPSALSNAGDSLLQYFRDQGSKLVCGYVPYPPCPAGVDRISWDEDCYQAKKRAKAEYLRN
jgi:hypothetical protein